VVVSEQYKALISLVSSPANYPIALVFTVLSSGNRAELKPVELCPICV